MKNEFKSSLLKSLLIGLFVISNIIGLKYTEFNNYSVPCTFITIPFMGLLTLLIVDLEKKDNTYRVLISGFITEIVISISCLLVSSLSSQSIINDYSNYINNIFNIDFVYGISNLISFVLSGYILIYIYEYFRVTGKKILGSIIALISYSLLYGLIVIGLTNYSYGTDVVIKLLINYMFSYLSITLVTFILFLLFKEKEELYNVDNLFVKDVAVSHVVSDKTIEEIIDLNSKKIVNPRKKRIEKNKKNDSNKKVNMIKENNKNKVKLTDKKSKSKVKK